MQELPKVAIGLKDAWPSLGLDNLLQSTCRALNERSERDHNEDLKNVIKDAVGHRSAPQCRCARAPPSCKRLFDREPNRAASAFRLTYRRNRLSVHHRTTARCPYIRRSDFERRGHRSDQPVRRLRRTPSPCRCAFHTYDHSTLSQRLALANPKSYAAISDQSELRAVHRYVRFRRAEDRAQCPTEPSLPIGVAIRVRLI